MLRIVFGTLVLAGIVVVSGLDAKANRRRAIHGGAMAFVAGNVKADRVMDIVLVFGKQDVRR